MISCSAYPASPSRTTWRVPSASPSALPTEFLIRPRMRRRWRLCPAVLLSVLIAACISLFASSLVLAHGFAGKRFFPATLTTDDPFVADELSLPTISKRLWCK